MKFADVLRELEIPFREAGEHHHTRPGWIQLDCPFCGPGSEKWHLGYSLNGNYLNCWQCGPQRLVETLAELSGRKLRECSALLHDITRVREFEQKDKRGKLVLPKALGPLKKCQRQYLRSRGFNVKRIERLWQVQGIGINPPYSWSIFIPITLQGAVVSWTTRSISNEGLRYNTAPAECESISAKNLLYGMDYCRHAIIIVEGPLDVWNIGPGAAAIMGLGYKQAQVLKMSQFPVRVVCFDSEPAAQKRARRLCDKLEVFPGKTYNVVLNAKDPGEAEQKEIRQLRKEFLD